MDKIEQLGRSLPLLFRMAFTRREHIAVFEADAKQYFAGLFDVPKENVITRYDESTQEMDVEITFKRSETYHFCTLWR